MIETRVAGIPCLVEYLIRGRYTPAKVDADPDSCFEAEYPDLEWQVLDRRGRVAPWLEAKLTPDDETRIERQIWQHAT